MLDQPLRQVKEAVLMPVARAVSARATPTGVTLAGLAVGIASAGAAYAGIHGLALVLWLANRALDGLDGTIARVTGRQSDLGGYIDILADHVVYAALPFALAFNQQTFDALAALGFLLASFYINAASWMYLAAILEQRQQGAKARGEKTTITMPTGIIEGTETVIFFSLFFLFPAHIAGLFVLMGALVLATTLQRLLWARAHLR